MYSKFRPYIRGMEKGDTYLPQVTTQRHKQIETEKE